MNVFATQKVVSSNRVSLGPKIREILDVKEGDYLNFILDGENVIIRKVEV